MEACGGLMMLGYIICRAVVLPLTVAFLWTGIRAFRTLRRALASMKACPTMWARGDQSGGAALRALRRLNSSGGCGSREALPASPASDTNSLSTWPPAVRRRLAICRPQREQMRISWSARVQRWNGEEGRAVG
jgi:hypothetical protein